LIKTNYGPQTNATLQNFKPLLELDIMMGCYIEWGGESEVVAPAAAAETVSGASAVNNDDDDSGDERGGEGGAGPAGPARGKDRAAASKTLDELLNAEVDDSSDERGGEGGAGPQAPRMARTAPPPLSSQALCSLKGKCCQEDSIVLQEHDLSDRRYFLEFGLQERDTGQKGNCHSTHYTDY
jgi:hypothetical protein